MSDRIISRPSPYRWLIRVLAVLIVAAGIYRYSAESPVAVPVASALDLPKLKIIPPFALTERSGKTITNRDLAGKVWVADFVYTTCPGPCPTVTANMARLQNALANDPNVQLVTFTVDPQNDTPGVLAAYADKFGADPSRWWFLTGPEKPLYDLIENGFWQSVQDNRSAPVQDGQFAVTHSTRFVLIDTEGTLRGAYDGIGATDRDKLLQDIARLEKEAQP